MKIAYFHSTNEYRTEFTSRVPGRPTFYWFSDRFHDHYGYGIKGTYFYLFVKDPIADEIALRARGGEQRDFHDLYTNFVEYKNEILSQQNGNEVEYAEPPILMSFDYMTPDLIAQYHEDKNEYEILYPEANAGIRFTLYERPEARWSIGIPFTQVKELNEILPDLCNALPFQKPEHIDGRYIYDRWVPMVTEKNGTWL